MTFYKTFIRLAITYSFLLGVPFVVAQPEQTEPLALVPKIDQVGQYSRVSEISVRAGDQRALDKLASGVSRRISGRTGNAQPLRFVIEKGPEGVVSPAYMVLGVDRVSAAGAGLKLECGDQVYAVEWDNPDTWTLGQTFCLSLPEDGMTVVLSGTKGVVVFDAFIFPAAEDYPDTHPEAIMLKSGETMRYVHKDAQPQDANMSEEELSSIQNRLNEPGYYQRPYSLSPYSKGLRLEDVWPTLWLTSKQVEPAVATIRGKIDTLPWAAEYWELLKEEADVCLQEPPQVPLMRAGWRHDFYSPDTGEHLLYNQEQSSDFLDPLTGKTYNRPEMRQAWTLLTHERTFKIMRTIGILYAVTGDERYAEWVAEGMRQAAGYIDVAKKKGWGRSAFGGKAIWYQPLYDSTMLLTLANAYALTRDSGAYSEEDHALIRTGIFEDRIPDQIRFLNGIPGLQNMAAYAAAAVAVAGELYGRQDWIDIGVGNQYGFKRWLEANVPVDASGQIDGLWNEQTTFYHFYALAPLITLYNLDPELSGRDRERFIKMFEAPLELVGPDLNFHLMGDLAAPGHFSLIDVRAFYEFAAGKLDPAVFSPVLSVIYEDKDVSRGGLWSLIYGPDKLPPAGNLSRGDGYLPVSGYCVFRDEDLPMEVGFRTGVFHGGHDHPDRLSIFINGLGEMISPDLGEPGYRLRKQTGDYFRRTISHNTIFADEMDNRGNASLDWEPDSRPARARGTVNYKGVEFERMVFFDPPYLVLIDNYKSSDSHRYGWVFHAYGDLELDDIELSPSGNQSTSLEMPALPEDGPGYGMLTRRESGVADGELRGHWTLPSDVNLNVIVCSDGAFEVTKARSAGNPFPQDRGALLLRAPGETRYFCTVFELNKGESMLGEITKAAPDEVVLALKDGTVRTYQWK